MRNLQRAQIGPVIWRVLAFSIVGGVAVLLLLTSGAFAGDSPSRKIAALPLAPELQASALARPTVVWMDFCRQVPTECSINLSEPEKIKLTRATWNTIKAINNRVNGSIISLSDQDHWGSRIAGICRTTVTATARTFNSSSANYWPNRDYRAGP